MQHCPCTSKRKRRHFHAKTTSAKLYIYIGVGSRDLFIDRAHTVLDIYPACCLVRFVAFFSPDPCFGIIYIYISLLAIQSINSKFLCF